MTWGEPQTLRDLERGAPGHAVRWTIACVLLLLALAWAYDVGYSHGLDVGVRHADDRAYNAMEAR